MQLVKKNFLDSGIHLAISWPSIDISAHIGLRLCHHDLEPGEKPTTLENKFPTARRATTRITENMKPLVIYQSNRKFRVVILQLDKNFWGKSHWWTFTTTNPHKVPEKKWEEMFPWSFVFSDCVTILRQSHPPTWDAPFYLPSLTCQTATSPLKIGHATSSIGSGASGDMLLSGRVFWM